nr:phage tail spike protein [uncultured Ruminococcus sp.]
MFPKIYDEFQMQSPQQGGYSYRYRGTLTHCRKCEVTEVRNGTYTLSLETTVNDECADLILSQRMIGVKPNPTDNMQFFEIQKTDRTLDGIIKAEAKHIKCLCFAICTDGGGTTPEDPFIFHGTAQQTWNELVNNNISSAVPFSFTSDIGTIADFKLGLTISETLGNILGGKEGSFLDVYGGEYKWDNFNIYLYASRGANRHYKIKYGQNISDASQTESCENVYSHILPYAWISTPSSAKVSISAPLVAIPNNSSTYQKVYGLDCTELLDPYVYGSSQVPGTITLQQAQAMMTAYALQYASVNSLGNLDINIDVTLRAELDEMSQIGLCDTVKVILDPFGTSATAKITSVTYDALLERWNKIVIGSPKITVADLILDKRRFIS